ncbi:MAG: ComEC/Rec2 family competence protein [Clostridiales bacterium]|nr:ComEC/Rec2 family competence protein [Clostridiales bacterium]
MWIPVLLLLGAVLLLVLLTGGGKKEKRILAVLCAALALAAFFRCGIQDASYRQIQDVAPTGSYTQLTGSVYRKEIKSNSYLYYLKTQYKTVLVYADTDEIPIGSAVTAAGEAESFSPATNEGVFDQADYYRRENISFRMYADTITPEHVPSRSLRETLYQLQKKISAVFSSELNARDAGVLATLVTGNRGLMDTELKELYRDAGISHILAVSGLHISILGMGVFRFLRKIRCSYPVSAVLGSAVVLCFVLMSGMGVSAVRAMIMYLALMGAEVLGRTYDSLNALAVAALILLIRNPLYLNQSGFQFSFLAMGAIVLSSRVTQRLREKIILFRAGDGQNCAGAVGKPSFDGKIKEGGANRFFVFAEGILRNLPERLLSGAFLQIFLLPLTAWYYYEVPLYALFLNMLVLPLCSGLLGAGLAGGLAGLFFPQISKWILVVCHIILLIYEKAIGLVNVLPFSQVITGRPAAWMLLLYYAALVGACLWFLRRESGREGERTRESETEGVLCGFHPAEGLKISIGEIIAKTVAFRMALCVPIVLLSFMLFVPKREFCRIDFLDVGQGDGIYLADGEGMHVMIDGGSTSESEVGTYRIAPFLKYHGVRKVDVWIVTHGDLDHYSGLLELLEDGYEIDYLLLAESMPQDNARETLVEEARENGTEVVFTETGDAIRMADGEMTCLYPSAEDTGDDTNALSQVWSFERDGMSVLFTGDIGEEQEELLVQRGLLRDYVVLKTAHHGSKYSSCEEFLEEVSAEYAVISCGEGNSYGHPHAEALERLEDAGSEILLTQDEGQITFYEDQGSWKIKTFVRD